MAGRENVINCLTDIEQIMIARQEFCPREELQYWVDLQEGVADALELLKDYERLKEQHKSLVETCDELLKDQDAETKRILKIIWDTLHEGLSIDTVPDQDWVYERIRNRIEGTYDET